MIGLDNIKQNFLIILLFLANVNDSDDVLL